MDLTRHYKINKDKITYRIVDSEAIILNLDNRYYYSLNEVGTEIWELFTKGETAQKIIDIIADGYNVDKKKVKDDLIGFINELKGESLIQANNE